MKIGGEEAKKIGEKEGKEQTGEEARNILSCVSAPSPQILLVYITSMPISNELL